MGPLILMAIGLIAMLLVACGDTADGTSTASPTATVAVEATGTTEATPITVTDSDGFVLEFAAPPERIISFSPGATEILFAIGAGDQVIAVDEFSDYPAAAVALEHVSYSEPDPEQALGLDPDLVILATRQQESVEQFRSLDLRVLFNREPESVQAVLDNILLFGQITGHEAEAAALVAEMTDRIEAVTSALASITTGPTVFYELSDGLYTVAPDTFIGGTLALVKAKNIAEGAETAFPQLTAEAVIEANPAVVLLADAEFGGSLEALQARPGWDVIDAVVNERVYPVDPDIGNRPGPRIADAIEQIAKLLYPELFP
ncbi:MAG: ABC transporter substrate-binding protein [Chloroflexi bacterium]|nr:ABC transporter substrate-binding protein [Chloroflexota bacterium]MDA1147612.1 ABC transporter substrate-binding protein [Chloroflexota bacterium]